MRETGRPKPSPQIMAGCTSAGPQALERLALTSLIIQSEFCKGSKQSPNIPFISQDGLWVQPWNLDKKQGPVPWPHLQEQSWFLPQLSALSLHLLGTAQWARNWALLLHLHHKSPQPDKCLRIPTFNTRVAEIRVSLGVSCNHWFYLG